MEPQPGAVSTEQVAVVGRRVPSIQPRVALQAFDRPRFAWSTADMTVVGGGAAVALAADGPDRFSTIRRRAEHTFAALSASNDLPQAARPRLFGGFAFHDDHHGEGPWSGFPASLFVLPALQLVETESDTWLTAACQGPAARENAVDRLDTWASRLSATPALQARGPPGVQARRTVPDRDGWRDQVTRALDRIDRGELRKVVLAQALEVDLARSPTIPDVLERLGRTYPDCTRFLIDPEQGGTFFGATPEQLVERSGRSVRTTVLAGSTGRGDTSQEDAWLAADLQDSPKDNHEHEVVLDAIRDQLAPLATAIETGNRGIRQLATVQHLQTDVRAELDGDHHVLDLVEALHPTPAVGGMPQDVALDTIGTSEAFDRGWYAAPVGWIDAAGDGRFAVAIRSAVARHRSATLFAGAGIVADSEPDREWSEVQLKYRPVLDELE
ncbi:MAG: isochorismate synthase MenF [Salinirussus sp.]